MDETISSSAKQRVFETPELLEHILVYLDLKSLLVSAQRVSRGWNTLINTSPTLQKALFFQVDDGSSNHKVVHDEQQPERKCSRRSKRPIPNPLLVKAFPAWFQQTQTRSSLLATSYSDTDSDTGSDGLDDSSDDSDGAIQTIVESHHGVPRFMHPDSDDSNADNDSDGEEEGWDLVFPNQHDFPKQPFASSQSSRSAFEYPDASWRRMLVYQAPPIRTIAVWERVVGGGGGGDSDVDEFSCTVFSIDGAGTTWKRELVLGTVDRDEGEAGSDENNGMLSKVIESRHDDAGLAQEEGHTHSDDVGHTIEDAKHDDFDDDNLESLADAYEDVFSSLAEWKTEHEGDANQVTSPPAADQGLRMGEFFNFTVYETCRGGARKVAHWSWAGAVDGHYQRKTSRGLGRYGPLPLEVKINWDEVADGVDLVLSSSCQGGWCGTESLRQSLENDNFQKSQEGMKSSLAEARGLKKAWYWEKDYGAPDA